MATQDEEPMSQEEIARMGGEAVLEEYGPGFYKHIGKKGAEAVKEKYGSEFYSEIGKKGGEAVLEKYGTNYFSEIAQGSSQPEEDTQADLQWEGSNMAEQGGQRYSEQEEASISYPSRPVSQILNELNEIVMQVTALLSQRR